LYSALPVCDKSATNRSDGVCVELNALTGHAADTRDAGDEDDNDICEDADLHPSDHQCNVYRLLRQLQIKACSSLI